MTDVITRETGGDLERLRSQLRAFVGPRCPGGQVSDEQDIVDLGVVNSLFAMELVLVIEKAIGCRIPNSELSLDSFRSVDTMTALAGRLLSPAPESV